MSQAVRKVQVPFGDAPTLAYRTVRHADQSITVEWLGRSECAAADIAAGRNEPGQQSALRDAMYVLYSVLAEGGVPASEVIRAAKAAGISERTLKRAKHALRVQSKKRGSGRDSCWFWYLPEDEHLYRPLKDKDLDELLDRLIYGDVGLAPPQRKEQNRNPSPEDDDHRGDDGDAGRPMR